MTLNYCVLPLLSRTRSWAPQTNRTQSQMDYQDSTWVQLLELPNPYSHDEALLLCQQSEDEWVAWIPDHGEAVLHTSQFIRPPA
ncbi:hypothetical protein NDI44_10925 [Trichocoleus sp. DQ-A3]|uniref:hypothetical protein n=1 Tax=Cyanophyceae TaxID=3028117 RepID=UPI0016828E16|nr:hypothetical protein [Coleofasciculus sp. FACHB-125]MBD1902608.1 hypothetical protein [Coleofasciculus sp. FACHB-125]